MEPNQDVRWKQRFQSFERALVLLREPFARDVTALSALEREGTLRRLGVTLELAWKTLKDYLEHEGRMIQPVTPRNVVKEAFAAGVVRDGQVWIDMFDHRILLSHTYSTSAFEGAVLALRDRYLTAMEELYAWFHDRRRT